MINLYTIATNARALSEILNLPMEASYKPFYQARPGMRLPFVICTGGRAQLSYAYWGCIPEKFTTSLQVFPMEKIMTHPPMNRWIHTQRCLIPANCFFCRDAQSGQITLVRSLNARLFLMAGIYATQPAGKQVSTHHFILLTTDSADVLRPLTPEMPVMLTTDDYLKWLETDHLIDLMEIADRSGEHWFDYFSVDRGIIQPGVNKRALLKPLGLSHEAQMEREQKLKAVDIRQDRFDRKGSKR